MYITCPRGRDASRPVIGLYKGTGRGAVQAPDLPCGDYFRSSRVPPRASTLQLNCFKKREDMQ